MRVGLKYTTSQAGSRQNRKASTGFSRARAAGVRRA